MRRSDLIILLITLVLFSCNRKGKDGVVKLENKDISELTGALNRISTDEITTFYTKASTNYSDSSRNVNFKTSIRAILDSIVNIDIKYSAIPLVNAVVTADSLKVVNRRDKCRVLNSISALKEQFGIEFTLNDFEDLLLGKPINFAPDKTYYQLEDEQYYVVCTHSKKDFKKIAKDKNEAVVIRYFLSSELDHIRRVVIESTLDDAIIVIEYKGFERIGERLLPTGLTIDIKIGEKAPLFFEMDYSKTRVNEAEEIYFVIPEGYEDCSTE